jgi:hypothetical protein
MRAATRMAPVTAVALALAGCATTPQSSSGNFQGEAHSVSQTVDDLASAGTSHDGTKVCNELISQALFNTLNSAKGGCQTAVSDQLKDADVFDVTVVANGIQVNGLTATARVKDTQSGHNHFDTLNMVKEQRGSVTRWRISGLR